MTTALINTPCIIVRASTGDVDNYGDPEAQYGAGEETVCEFQQALSREDDLEQAERVEHKVWFLGSIVPPSGADKVLVGGVEYQFKGDTNPWRNPRLGVVDHIEAVVERVT